MNNFSVEERQIGKVAILDIKGKLSGCGNSTTLHDVISRVMNEGRNQILLNLAYVSYIDSSCLGVLVTCKFAVIKEGGRIKLFHLTPRLRGLMLDTKLLSVFEIYDDESAALDSFMKDTGEFAMPQIPLPPVPQLLPTPIRIPINWLTHLFGCWHKKMNNPFTRNNETYRTCITCGARRHFNVERSRMTGPYYNVPPSALYDSSHLI